MRGTQEAEKELEIESKHSIEYLALAVIELRALQFGGSVECHVVFQLHGEVHPQCDHLSPLQGPGHPGSQDV